MIQNLTSALQKKVDKSNWQTYRFDELVHNIVEKVSPRESGLEKYIGLEHLDSGSLKIKRFGSTQAIKGDKLKIYKGDLIFAKRNSYLKRVAIADEDAVASAHSLVLRAKVENVNPSFLPFFLLSETFWSRAIQISVGSLSPTINWKVLARQEFLLPPKDQQAELAELLWAAEHLIENMNSSMDSALSLKQAQLKAVFKKEACDKYRISDIAINLDNKRKPIAKSLRIKGSTPYYGASGIVDYVEGYTHNEPILLIAEDGENLNSRNLPIAYSVDGECWVNNHTHVLQMKSLNRYLVKEYFNSSDVSNYITGGTRPKITKGSLMSMFIYLPKPEFLAIKEKELRTLDTTIGKLQNAINESKNLLSALINQIF